MEHIYTDDAGTTQFGAYFPLPRVRPRSPAGHGLRVRADPTRYALTDPGTLHDAWLEAAEVREEATGARGPHRSIEITLRLLGAFHDRVHVLWYREVSAYRIALGATSNGHGDLLTHEVRMAEDGAIIHELAFASGGSIEVRCAEFSHEEAAAGAPNTGAV